MRTMRRGALVGVAVAATIATGALPAMAEDNQELGSAYALKVRAEVLDLLGGPEVNIPPTPQASTNGPRHPEPVVELEPLGLGTVEALTAEATTGPRPGQVEASASAVDLELRLAPLKISADLVEASCHATPQGLTGTTNLVELQIGDEDPIRIKPEPNQELELPLLDGVSVTLNEQIRDGDELTVNAVHIEVDGPLQGIVEADVIISSATCRRADVDDEPDHRSRPRPDTPDTKDGSTDVDEGIKPVEAPPAPRTNTHTEKVINPVKAAPPVKKSWPRPKGSPATGVGGRYELSGREVA
jgi:hypothetical protein